RVVAALIEDVDETAAGLHQNRDRICTLGRKRLMGRLGEMAGEVVNLKRGDLVVLLTQNPKVGDGAATTCRHAKSQSQRRKQGQSQPAEPTQLHVLPSSPACSANVTGVRRNLSWREYKPSSDCSGGRGFPPILIDGLSGGKGYASDGPCTQGRVWEQNKAPERVRGFG